MEHPVGFEPTIRGLQPRALDQTGRRTRISISYSSTKVHTLGMLTWSPRSTTDASVLSSVIGCLP